MKSLLLASLFLTATFAIDAKPNTADPTVPDDFSATGGIQGEVKEKLSTLVDNTVKITSGNLLNICYWFREYKIVHKLVGGDYDKIYYTLYQCLKEDMSLNYQKTYFSYSEADKGFPLPAGCPPPSPPAPTTPDPCKNGFQVGDVVSRVVSRIIVPQIINVNDTAPIAQEDIFKKYKDLQTTASKTDFVQFTEEQNKIIQDFADYVSAAANDKIKCFTENVTPVKEMDIKFVCAKEGAYQTIKDALQAALGSQALCGSIACDDIEKNLRDKMAKGDQDGVSVVGLNKGEVKPGDADINGNINLPADGENYLIFSRASGLSIGPEGSLQAGNSIELQTCSGDGTQLWTFVKTGTSDSWKIKSGNDLYLTIVTQGGDVTLEKIRTGPEQNWKLQLNADGSAMIVNEKYVYDFNVDKGLLVTGTNIINGPISSTNAEKFTLRKDCLTPIKPGVPNLSGNVAIPVAGANYFIVNAATKFALNDFDKVVVKGVIAQGICGKHENQGWQFTPNTDGTWAIQNGVTGLYVTIDADKTIIFDSLDAAKNQRWKLVTDDAGQVTIVSIADQDFALMIDPNAQDSKLIYGVRKNVLTEIWQIRTNC